eukprot:10124386-Alexandrium_andersonii.AAC.1
MLTGTPTAASWAKARCFSSPKRRLANCRRSRKDGGSNLSPSAGRKSPGRSWSRAQMCAHPRPAPGRGRFPALCPRPPDGAVAPGALQHSCAGAGTPGASGTRAARSAAPAPH